MGFVFIFRTERQRQRADKLAKALRRRGIDVCVGLDREPVEVRASVSRALIDHCALMVAVCSDLDMANPGVAEPMRYAVTLGKLLALCPQGVHMPANLGPVHGVSQNWTGDAAELSEACDAIIAAASRNAPPGEFENASDGAASQEYAAYGQIHKQGGVDAMARFLRTYPGGMFEEIVRAELDAATRPTYEPAHASSRLAFARDESAGEEPERVWRMGDWSPWRAIGDLRKYLPWIGAAVLVAVAVAVVALVPRDALNFVPGAGRSGQSAQTESDSGPTARIRLAPAEVEAAPAEANALTDVPDDSAPVQTAELRPSPVAAERASDRVAGVIPASPPPPESEPVVTASLTPPTTPPPEPASASPGPDISQLEPAMREVVQRARSAEGRAYVQARSRAGVAHVVTGRSSAGTGVYYGDWSDSAANGVGRALWANGDAYAGAWAASRPDGYGVLRLDDGRRYEGEFSAGSPTGRGVFWGADGRRLTGDALFSALVSARSR
jgi:hypothetical protein